MKLGLLFPVMVFAAIVLKLIAIHHGSGAAQLWPWVIVGCLGSMASGVWFGLALQK